MNGPHNIRPRLAVQSFLQLANILAKAKLFLYLGVSREPDG